MPAMRNAADVGASVRTSRRAQGLTQAQLADQAGVGRQWLVALEKGHERAELAKVLAVLSALGLVTAARRDSPAPPRRTWLTATDAAEAIREELERGDTDFALRLLARALNDFRALTDPAERDAFLAEPPSTGDHRWDTLLAVTVGRVCRQASVTPPEWTRARPLTSWWFPVFDPLLTARTIQRTPADLAAKGIWLDERALGVV